MSKEIQHLTKAVVLLSGGLDSATALAWALDQGWACTTLSFNYGQRHDVELQAAVKIADIYGITDHRVIDVSLGVIGGSALTSSLDVPKDLPESSEIPVTYVPARNLVFLSLAAGLAETVGAMKIVIGANVVDYSGYPDCRPDFLSAFETVANLGTKAGAEGQRFEVVAPLICLDKSEIIRLGLSLGVDYGLTRSCYDPDTYGNPCGHCDSCLFRKSGFDKLGEKDPLNYRDS
ncbi:MAG: 7-cyano-7-deazaguanine synthase QueC [Zetaproteobacteria bacterium]|nr:7-cyano-7-deazaguanine synthase QueC [Zetaproteobacteria bacterium]